MLQLVYGDPFAQLTHHLSVKINVPGALSVLAIAAGVGRQML